MGNNKKKICVVGAGNWGINHIKTLKELNALGGVVEKDDQSINFLKSNFTNCRIHKDLEDALNENYDGYIVSTPPASHFEIARNIIEAKRPLLVEKPLTLNLRDAMTINELAKRNKVNLMVGHVLLFHPAFIKIAELIDSGLIGQIQYMYSNRINLGTIRTDENVFWSFAPHDIALFNFFFKENPIEVNSNGVDILQKNIHDTTITSFKYTGNRMGHIFVSWLHPFKEHRFVIIGSNGMIHFDDTQKNKPLIFYDKKVEFYDSIPSPQSGEMKIIQYKNEQPLTNELRYFISNLESDKIAIANGDSGVEVIRILEAASKNLNK